METHALKSPKVNEVMNLLQKTPFVVLLGRSFAPEFVRDDLRQNSLAKG